MAIYRFTKREKELIKESIHNRMQFSVNDSKLESKHRLELVDLLARLKRQFIELKPLEKARIIGLMRECFIDVNSDLFTLKYSQLLNSTDDTKERVVLVDDALSLVNKLKLKKEKQEKLLKDIISAI